MEIAKHEKEGNKDDGFDRGDEGEVVGQMAVVLLDGKEQNSDEEDGQGQGHHDIFGEFAHSFVFYHEFAKRINLFGVIIGFKISEYRNFGISG